MKTKIQEGDKLELTAPYAVTSGDGLLVGAIFGVASFTAGNGEQVTAHTRGVFELPKLSTDVVAAGDPLWWDNTNKRLTKTGVTGMFAVGKATKAAGNGVTTVEVLIDPGMSIAVS